MKEVLLVDDELAVRKGVRDFLVAEGFSVRTARDGEDALKKFSDARPDIVLLDVMMPKLNGFRTCEEIRRMDASVPVIFLTAKDSDLDQIRGLGLGGDDYVSKDVSEAVLLARVNRALERSRRQDEQKATHGGEKIRLGSVTVDLRTLSVCEEDAEIAVLTRTEADLLKCLDAKRGELVLFSDLIVALRGNGYACEDEMLYVHMSHLRGKLGAASEKISTKRGVGYVLSR